MENPNKHNLQSVLELQKADRDAIKAFGKAVSFLCGIICIVAIVSHFADSKESAKINRVDKLAASLFYKP